MQSSDERFSRAAVKDDSVRSLEPEPSARITVRVEGSVGGQRIDRGAEVELLDEAIVFAWHQAAPWTVSLDGVDGVSCKTRECTIHLTGGDALTLTGSEQVRTLATQ